MTSRQRSAPSGPAVRAVVVAKLYDLSVSTLGRWRRNGYGPPWQEEHTPGGGVIHLYPEADAIRWGREHGYIHNGDTP